MLADYEGQDFWGRGTHDWDNIDQIRSFLQIVNEQDNKPVNPTIVSRLAHQTEQLDRLRDKTRMKIVIKGIVTAEDARL